MGGGGVSIPQRQLGPELGQLNQAFWKNVFPSFSRFLGQSPLLTAGQPWITSQLQAGPTLTPQESEQVTQDVGSELSAAGMRHTDPGIFAIELGKQKYGQQLFNTALQQATGLSGAQTGNFMNLYGPTLGFGQDVFSSNQNAAAAANIANANKSGGLLSGGTSALTSLASTGILAAALSDKRAKKNIRDTGETTEEGIPIKTFEYKHRIKGVMAQDVEKVRPDAVIEHPSGMKMVNYSALRNAPFQFLALGGEVKDEVEKLHKVPPFIMLPIMGNPALDQYFKHVGFEELQEGGDVKKKKKKKTNTDTVPIMATPGEFMHNTGSVALFGRDFHNWMNEAGKRFMRMQQGGQVEVVTEQSDLQGREREGGPITPEEMEMLHRARMKAAEKKRKQTMNEPMFYGGEIRSNKKGTEKPGMFMQEGGHIGPWAEPSAIPNWTPNPNPTPMTVFAGDPGAGLGMSDFAPFGYGFGFMPNIGTPGFMQGPTAIPTTFDQSGYPFAVPVFNNPTDPVGLMHAGQQLKPR